MMRNINELLSIIREIGCTDSISDNDILRLQSWTDRNRNLAFEQRQAELIKWMDLTISNRTLEKDNVEAIITRASEILEEIGDTSGKIYELNEILKDNSDVVSRLYHWMNENKEYLDSQDNIEVFDAINELFVCPEEYENSFQRLKDVVSNQINHSQFEIKLKYLREQVRNKKIIGTDLIEILDNEYAVEEIHTRAERQLLKALSSYSSFCVDQDIIVVSLILIALLEYDGNYYGNVRTTYYEAYRRYSEQKIEGLIRSILSRYRKEKEVGSRTRIINVVLENAIVPQTFLSAFFEFIYDIYKLNFDYDISDDLYEDFRFVFEGLRSNMLSDGDDISIKVTQKTYKLTAATKQLFLRADGLEAIIKLSTIIVKLIDKRFWDKDVLIFNPYLKTGYEGWESQLKETAHGKRIHRSSENDFKSRWEPKFLMLDNSICLVPPMHRVKAQYDYRDITITVINDGKEIYKNNSCDIREIIGGYQINSQRIEIDQPLGKLTYRLTAGNEVIYDSKDKMYRDYIVFNDDGHEIVNNTDYIGRAFFCYKQGNVEVEKILQKEFYCIGYKLVHEGDAIEIGADVFNFSSMIRPGIFGECHKNCQICQKEHKNSLSVYKNVSIVVFEAETSISDKFEIVISGKAMKLSEMPYKSTNRGNITKYVVDLSLTENGIHTIEVNQIIAGKKNRILFDRFAIDNELVYEVSPSQEGSCHVIISSAFFDGVVEEEISPEGFQLDYWSFRYAEDTFFYSLPLNLGFYQIDDGQWNSISEDMWIDDVSLESKLTLFDSECDGLLVYHENGTLAEENVAIRNLGAYQEISIGFLNSYKTSNNYVLLVFTRAGLVKYAVRCYNHCVIDKDRTSVLFSENPKQVTVTPVFHGKNRVFFEVFNSAGEKVFMSMAHTSGNGESFKDFNSFEEYTINFHEKTKVLMLRKNTLLDSLKMSFYAQQDFVGRTFKIDKAYLDQYVGNSLVEQEKYFSKAYVRITEFKEPGVFEGQVFVKTVRGEWRLDNINPVEVEICSEIIDDTMDIYMTNEGDGLLYDTAKHGILNSTTDRMAPDIFLYTVSLKGDAE